MFWVLSGLCFTLAIQGVLSLQSQRQLNLLRIQDAALIDSASRLMQHHLQEVHTALCALAHAPVIQRLAAHPRDPALRDEVGRFIRTVMDEAQIYDQLRFIDRRGMEQIRVDLRDAGAVLTPDEALQDKSDRYFFQEAMRLPPGAIYMSPLDLNIEHGQVEVPDKPMVRLATPLFDSDGQRLGIVIVNVYGAWLIQEFRQLMPPQREAIWLNAQGDWLTGPDPSRDWGFMFGHPGAFAQAQPSLWAQMRRQPQGQLLQADGLWTYTTLQPLKMSPRRGLRTTAVLTAPVSTPSQDYAWVLATRIAPAHLPSPRIFDNPLAPGVHLAGLVVLGGFSVFLARVLDSRRRLQQQAANQADHLGNITAMMSPSSTRKDSVCWAGRRAHCSGGMAMPSSTITAPMSPRRRTTIAPYGPSPSTVRSIAAKTRSSFTRTDTPFPWASAPPPCCAATPWKAPCWSSAT